MRQRLTVLLSAALACASLITVSAHVIRGVASPTLATAFVSSPSATADQPVKLAWGTVDTGNRVACFYVANTSAPRLDQPAWPQVSTVGFELPGRPSGFALVEPLDGDWDLVENVAAVVGDLGTVALDFALVPRANPIGNCPHGVPHPAIGLLPGAQPARGSGTRFCVSGPFPDGLSIEQIINGVVVRFHRTQPYGTGLDTGIWDNPQRVVPLFP
jgi:hypothetical protein